jgi:hypothetical protein
MEILEWRHAQAAALGGGWACNTRNPIGYEHLAKVAAFALQLSELALRVDPVSLVILFAVDVTKVKCI